MEWASSTELVSPKSMHKEEKIQEPTSTVGFTAGQNPVREGHSVGQRGIVVGLAPGIVGVAFIELERSGRKTRGIIAGAHSQELRWILVHPTGIVFYLCFFLHGEGAEIERGQAATSMFRVASSKSATPPPDSLPAPMRRAEFTVLTRSKANLCVLEAPSCRMRAIWAVLHIHISLWCSAEFAQFAS